MAVLIIENIARLCQQSDISTRKNTQQRRRIRRTPSKHKVPSNLLDIEQTLPNYEEVIGNIMVDAEKLWTIAEIETITKEAKENNHEA